MGERAQTGKGVLGKLVGAGSSEIGRGPVGANGGRLEIWDHPGYICHGWGNCFRKKNWPFRGS